MQSHTELSHFRKLHKLIFLYATLDLYIFVITITLFSILFQSHLKHYFAIDNFHGLYSKTFQTSTLHLKSTLESPLQFLRFSVISSLSIFVKLIEAEIFVLVECHNSRHICK